MAIKILGNHKLQKNNTITVAREAVDKLGVAEGDSIAFCENEQGEIVLKKASIVVEG